jgi:hypothetical protein
MRSMGMACVLFALGANAQVPAEYALENSKVRMALNAKAAITQLVDKQSDARHNLIARQTPGFWSLIFQCGVRRAHSSSCVLPASSTLSL